ncbi:hypothetical protein EDD22DRAFT_851951 [Suillus occidentalis]|nr:hypothetical protein EDD22DRAFT_851951 [Suillus occidentalis]
MQGQDYCWVAINHDQPRVGPPPIELSLRMDKVFNCVVLHNNDWSINTNYWDSSHPYHSYISTAPHRCIVHFDLISYDNLCNLLNNHVPIHYQWYTTNTGMFEPYGLRVYDYDDLQHMKHQPVRGDWDSTKQAIHLVAQPNAMSVAPSATPVAGSTKAKAKYYKMNSRKTEMILKKLYKDLAKVYFMEHL